MDSVSYAPTVPKLQLRWHVEIEIPDWGFNVLKCAIEREREKDGERINDYNKTPHTKFLVTRQKDK